MGALRDGRAGVARPGGAPELRNTASPHANTASRPSPAPVARPASAHLHAPTLAPAARLALGLAAVLALVAVAVARIRGAGVGGGVGLGLDLAGVAAVVAGYVSLAGSRPTASPVRALAMATLPALMALGVVAVGGWVDGGTVDPKTGAVTSTATAVWGCAAGLSVAVLSALLPTALRPLALHRPTRSTPWLWAGFLVLASVSALTVAGRPLTEYMRSGAGVFLVGAILAATGLSLRQSWIGGLRARSRWQAAGLAVVLSAGLAGLLVAEVAGPGIVRIGDGSGAVRAVPLAAVFGRPVAVLGMLMAAFGAIYALSSALVLLFGLPSAARAAASGERRALRSLADLSGRLLDRAELAEAIARGPVEAGLADAAWVALTDPRKGIIHPEVAAAAGISVAEADRAADADALYRASAETGAPLVLGQAAADHRVHVRPGDEVASLVALPLGGPDAASREHAGRLTRGVLLVARSATDAFDDDALAALDTFAGQAALSLSHADLFSDTLERERLARELTLAREVQQRLFPQHLPEVDGVELAAAERPAREVGGDYYDVVRLDDDCLGILVADVSGKGAPAAFYMAEMKGVFQAASRLTRSPGELLAGANDALAPSLGRGVFATAAYAVLDAEAGTLALARAGHTPAVLVRDAARPDGGRWLLRGDGLAIGLDRQGATFRRTLREQCVRLAPGDVLLLYTDGLVESRDADGEEYGYDRLAAFVERHGHTSALDLRDALLAEMLRWSGSDEPFDDTTFVVVRWTGRGAEVPPSDASPPLTERFAFERGEG